MGVVMLRMARSRSRHRVRDRAAGDVDVGEIIVERLAGQPFLIRPRTGQRGRVTPFSAPKQRGQDTQCCDHSAHNEGSMEAGHERLLQ
jgi:hypothetical protein